MTKPDMPANKGVALIAVITMLLFVAILGSIIAVLMSNQGKLTHHQAQRIRASYATQAGINLAYSKLSQGLWPYNDSFAINCTTAVCTGSVANDALHRYSDPDLPFEVIIVVGPEGAGAVAGTTEINATVNYTSGP